MTCHLCAKDAKYDLDISTTRFPYRQRFAASLCEEHKEKVIQIIDGLQFEYYSTIKKEKPE